MINIKASEKAALSFQILTNEIVLTPKDVKNIEISTFENGKYGIKINLKNNAAQKLEIFTKTNLNRPCQFIIGDTVISLSVIKRQ